MLTERCTAILFGFCLSLASCDGTRPDPTAPNGEFSPLDAATLTASNTWTTRRQTPFAVGGRTGTINGVIYVVGNVNAWGGPRPTLAYNVSNNTWTNRQPLPSVRSGINGATPINGKLYVTGGTDGSGQLTRTLFVYHPATDTWTKRADMPRATGCGIQGAIGGQLYVYALCIGVPRVPEAHQLFRYNPATNRWITLTPPPRLHTFGPFGGALGGKFYVGGGWWDHAPTGFVYAYDPATNSWADRAGLPHGGGHAFGAFSVVGGKLYVAGGTDDVGSRTNDLSVYDPVSNTWATKAPMPVYRRSAIGASGGGRFFVIGGSGNDDNGDPVDVLRRVDAYTP